jgi:hypothetical protein
MSELIVYRMKHKETGEYLKTKRGKTTWSTEGSAKNGWNAAQPYYNSPLFADQDMWVVERHVIVTEAKYTGMLHARQWLCCLGASGAYDKAGMTNAHTLFAAGVFADV